MTSGEEYKLPGICTKIRVEKDNVPQCFVEMEYSSIGLGYWDDQIGGLDKISINDIVYVPVKIIRKTVLVDDDDAVINAYYEAKLKNNVRTNIVFNENELIGYCKKLGIPEEFERIDDGN